MNTMNIDELVSENIKKLRLNATFTQEELAARMGISQAFLNQVECNKKHLNLRQINNAAIALSCNLHDIIPQKPIHGKDNG